MGGKARGSRASTDGFDRLEQRIHFDPLPLLHPEDSDVGVVVGLPGLLVFLDEQTDGRHALSGGEVEEVRVPARKRSQSDTSSTTSNRESRTISRGG